MDALPTLPIQVTAPPAAGAESVPAGDAFTAMLAALMAPETPEEASPEPGGEAQPVAVIGDVLAREPPPSVRPAFDLVGVVAVDAPTTPVRAPVIPRGMPAPATPAAVERVAAKSVGPWAPGAATVDAAPPVAQGGTRAIDQALPRPALRADGAAPATDDTASAVPEGAAGFAEAATKPPASDITLAPAASRTPQATPVIAPAPAAQAARQAAPRAAPEAAQPAASPPAQRELVDVAHDTSSALAEVAVGTAASATGGADASAPGTATEARSAGAPIRAPASPIAVPEQADLTREAPRAAPSPSPTREISPSAEPDRIAERPEATEAGVEPPAAPPVAAARDPLPPAAPTPADFAVASPTPAGAAPTEPSPATPQRAPVAWPARQVAPFAVALALGPDASLNLTLEPIELGRVEIAIERSGGEAIISVNAERPETLALLQRDRAELERALAGAGLGGDGRGATLSFGPGGEGAARREQRGQHAMPSRNPSATADAPGETRPRGLLDLAV